MKKASLILTFVLFFGCGTESTPVYTLTIDILPAEAGIVTPGTAEYDRGAEIRLEAKSAEEYQFISWSGDINATDNPLIFSINSDVSITAVFAESDRNTFSGGSGTDNDPYWVSTVGQLQSVDQFLDAHFIQVNSIDASSAAGWNNGKGFNPIGNGSTPFTGTFDGQGFEILGVVINRKDENEVGLFGYIQNARIVNVGLVNHSVYGNKNVGGLVGYNDNSITSHSYSTGYVSGDNHSIGGLIGINEGLIENSHTTGYVSGELFIGGLVGANRGTISSSYSAGDISGRNYIGGLVGANEAYGEISTSMSMSNVSGNTFIGGLVGANSQSLIVNSYAIGNVSGNSRIGGLVGYNLISSKIVNTFAVGTVTGNEDVGAIVGINSASVDTSYWDQESTGLEYGSGSGVLHGATGLDTDQITGTAARVNMPEFDWENIWRTADNYPILQWQNE